MTKRLRKVLEAIFVLLLICFSFYYTEKAISIVEGSDPIMQEIVKNKGAFEEEAVNATLEECCLIPGYSGLEVDTKESFQKMKQYGSYTENLLVFKEVKPTVSVDEYYDKYISSGNGFTNNVSLVFKVEKGVNIDEIVSILNEQNVRGTFFVDGLWLDENKDTVYQLARDFHEVEVLSYDQGYEALLFEGALDKLQIITSTKGKYCYAEYDQKEVLDLCSKENLHTIIPTIKVKNNAYNSVKGHIRGGSIVSMEVNKENSKELGVVINYIKQRGYTLDTLDNLLNEGRSLEK